MFVESFNTIDGALMYALGIHDVDTTKDDYAGSLKDRGNFV